MADGIERFCFIHGFAYTETWLRLTLVNGSRCQPAHRFSQSQPGEARHQVELGRPGVAELDRIRLDSAVGEDVVLRAEPLVTTS